MYKKVLILVFVLSELFVIGCYIPKKVKLDPYSDSFYKRARLLMTKQEEEVFLNLPDAKSRKAFIKEFWDIRDPNPYTEVNEYKEEIERRFEYASRYFKEAGRPGWDTDRGRIYILLGPPDSLKDYPMLSGYYKGVQVWLYGNYQLALQFADKEGDGRYELITYSTELLNAIEMAKYTLMGGSEIKVVVKPINFKLKYIKEKSDVEIKIPIKKLLLKEKNGKELIRIRVEFILYYPDKTFEKVVRQKQLSYDKEEILKKKDIIITFPLSISKKGKIHLDTIVTDLNSGFRGRKIFKIKL